uniref:Uncharacterized protein n=1 Tax=Anguilla anguilla TaxID=7936 RepID=A0A0E9UTS3_ANGAN
MNIKYYYA